MEGRSEKTLTVHISRSGGRNNQGRLTARHRGGGARRRYRLVDFVRRKVDISAEVVRFEYDPNRSAHLALIQYETGEKAYILRPQNLREGDKVLAGEKVDIRPGNAMPLRSMPVGTLVHNVEMKIAKGGQIARSAGSCAQIMGRDGVNVLVKMPSSHIHLIHQDCWASVGRLANEDHSNQSLGKAGRSRWKGWRPHVRGVAMNPVDHPHGGGEGRTSGGRHPVTPWGKSTKGKKTRNQKRTDSMIIRSRKRRGGR